MDLSWGTRPATRTICATRYASAVYLTRRLTLTFTGIFLGLDWLINSTLSSTRKTPQRRTLQINNKMFKANFNNRSQQELLSCCFCDHVSPKLNKLWLLLCCLRAPFQLASPPGFHVTHMSKGNLVLLQQYTYGISSSPSPGIPLLFSQMLYWTESSMNVYLYIYTKIEIVLNIFLIIGIYRIELDYRSISNIKY